MEHLKRTPQLCGLLPLLALFAFASSAAIADCKSEVGYVASFSVKPGHEAALESALIQLADTVNAVEDGVILYKPFKGAGDRYYMLERYASEEARRAHGQAPQVAALMPPIGEHLSTPPDIQSIAAVCVPTQTKTHPEAQ